MVYTGLRKDEMINLKWENVDLNISNPRINIVSSEEWKTKTGNFRSIPLNDPALEIVNRWKGRHEKFVFVSQTNQQINPNKPYAHLKNALKKAWT